MICMITSGTNYDENEDEVIWKSVFKRGLGVSYFQLIQTF